MRLLGVLGLSLLVVAGLTEKSMADVNCEQLPDCAALGFSTADDATCASDGYLYCPFDTSYKKCVKINDCTYQYSGTDPIKVGSDSCKRDGETFYEEICTGQLASECGEDYKFEANCTTYSGKIYGQCVSSCEYQYTTTSYPQVRQAKENDSCVRDGVTYWRDLCPGVSYNECAAEGGVLTDVCYAYNGNTYGQCSMPTTRDFKLILTLRMSSFADQQICHPGDWSIQVVFSDPDTGEEISSAQYRMTCGEFDQLDPVIPKDTTVNFSAPLTDGKKYHLRMVYSNYAGSWGMRSEFQQITVNGKNWIEYIGNESLPTGAVIQIEGRSPAVVKINAIMVAN